MLSGVLENSLPSQRLLQVKLRGIITSWKGLLLAFKPSTREAEDVLCELWAIQGYIVPLCFKTKTN